MYAKYLVPIPVIKGKIYIKNRKGTDYVDFEYDRVYKPEKKYNIPKRTTIGKVCITDPSKMYPNDNYYKFFPDAQLPEIISDGRSSCISIGSYIVIDKIIKDLGIMNVLSESFAMKETGVLLDLAFYSIVCENNASQYYDDFAYMHPSFTEGMHIYSDSWISEFLHDMTIDQRIGFLNAWNKSRNKNSKIYIYYDSTNKNCQAGDIRIVEFGHPKDDKGLPVFNYSLAFDCNNREPLFYEGYPGSIVDVSQLQYTLEKMKSMGYKNVGFILDRGYFCKENIQFMDKEGYQFIIMVKGMSALVNEIILENRGLFEEKRSCNIKKYRAYGTTVSRKLFGTDKKDRYFHLYFSTSKYSAQRESLETKLERYEVMINKLRGRMDVTFSDEMLRYYEPMYHNDGTFLGAMERKDAVERELQLCGYYVIITSEKMSAKEALVLYKSRDASEKLFRGDKSYLGNKSIRVYSEESAEAKIFIEFVALIIRNKIYTSLKDAMEESGTKANYMTVPAAIKELEKIQAIKLIDGIYKLDHAITATQKTILKSFGIQEDYVKERVRNLGELMAGAA